MSENALTRTEIENLIEAKLSERFRTFSDGIGEANGNANEANKVIDFVLKDKLGVTDPKKYREEIPK